jgi:hypothetical protein
MENDNTLPELLPCQCGHYARYRYRDQPPQLSRMVAVVCSDHEECSMQTGWHVQESDAAAVWNNRASGNAQPLAGPVETDAAKLAAFAASAIAAGITTGTFWAALGGAPRDKLGIVSIAPLREIADDLARRCHFDRLGFGPCTVTIAFGSAASSPGSDVYFVTRIVEQQNSRPDSRLGAAE